MYWNESLLFVVYVQRICEPVSYNNVCCIIIYYVMLKTQEHIFKSQNVFHVKGTLYVIWISYLP